MLLANNALTSMQSEDTVSPGRRSRAYTLQEDPMASLGRRKVPADSQLAV